MASLMWPSLTRIGCRSCQSFGMRIGYSVFRKPRATTLIDWSSRNFCRSLSGPRLNDHNLKSCGLFPNLLDLNSRRQGSLGAVVVSRGKKYNRKITYDSNEYQLSDDEDKDDEWAKEDGENFKDIEASAASLRLDLILKTGLGISRTKSEALFFGSKVRVNEEKILKKSKELQEGDEIDVILEQNTDSKDFIKVSRIVLLKVGDKGGKKRVLLRRYSNLLIRRYIDYVPGKSRENE